MMTAIGTPISIPVVELWLWLAGSGGAELVGPMAELCDAVRASELVELEEEKLDRKGLDEKELEEEELDEEELDDELGVNVIMYSVRVVAAPDCPNLPTTENGNGSSEVVRLVVQQPGEPGTPPQHQVLDSQRVSSVLPSN